MSEERGVLAARRKRSEGERRTIILPRDLKIAWGSDDTQWKIQDLDDDEKSGAEAIRVMWMEVKATYREAKAGKKYQIGFRISLKTDAFGWENCPVFLMVKIGGAGSYSWRKLYVDKRAAPVGKAFDFPNNFEIEVPITSDDSSLEFGLYEVWGGRWKGGLVIHHAFVREVTHTRP